MSPQTDPLQLWGRWVVDITKWGPFLSGVTGIEGCCFPGFQSHLGLWLEGVAGRSVGTGINWLPWFLLQGGHT